MKLAIALIVAGVAICPHAFAQDKGKQPNPEAIKRDIADHRALAQVHEQWQQQGGFEQGLRHRDSSTVRVGQFDPSGAAWFRQRCAVYQAGRGDMEHGQGPGMR